MVEPVRGMLQNWHFNGKTIVAHIYGDTRGRFPHGASIITSKVVTPAHEIVEGAIIETLNSFYKLGTPASDGLMPPVNANKGEIHP